MRAGQVLALLASFAVFSAHAETLLSNPDRAEESAKPSPFGNGNGKADDPHR